MLCKYGLPFTPSNIKRKLRETINNIIKDKIGEEHMSEDLKKLVKEQLQPDRTEFIQTNKDQTVEVKPGIATTPTTFQSLPPFHYPSTNTTAHICKKNSLIPACRLLTSTPSSIC